jgi:hypothetical protein
VPVLDKDGKITGYRGVGVNQYNPPGKEHGIGAYGRDVISSVPLHIGTGRGQYQIRHQIVKPPTNDSQVAAAVNGDGAQRNAAEAVTGEEAAKAAAAAQPDIFPGTQKQYEAYQESRGWKGTMLPPVEDRAQLDRAQSALHKVEGTGKITVDVNAPKGTNVGVEAGGLFRKTEVNRQTQMERAQGGPTSDTMAA